MNVMHKSHSTVDNSPGGPETGGKVVVMIAGEASGDIHGAHLVRAMRRIDRSLAFVGIGGDSMREAGVRILVSSADMAVVGLTEVVSKIPVIVKASRRIKSLLKHSRPDLLILVDYPDFNLHMAALAKRFGVPVLYFISPQVWAWRAGRVKKIRRRVDRMAVVFPFEREFYLRRGMEVDYVGHPLMDGMPGLRDRERCAAELGVGDGCPVVGLLPGSRKEEVRTLLPPMLGAADLLSRRYDRIRFVLPLAPTIDGGFVERFLEASQVPVTVFEGGAATLLGACHLALVASGTATLETAIMGVPMVIAYRVSPLTYLVGRLVISVPHIGLANLVAGETVVPELIQSEVTPEALAREAAAILDDEERSGAIRRKLDTVRERLGQGGASEKTARIALEMMGKCPIVPDAR